MCLPGQPSPAYDFASVFLSQQQPYLLALVAHLGGGTMKKEHDKNISIKFDLLVAMHLRRVAFLTKISVEWTIKINSNRRLELLTALLFCIMKSRVKLPLIYAFGLNPWLPAVSFF